MNERAERVNTVIHLLTNYIPGLSSSDVADLLFLSYLICTEVLRYFFAQILNCNLVLLVALML